MAMHQTQFMLYSLLVMTKIASTAINPYFSIG
jgi:hypothetical protein